MAKTAVRLHAAARGDEAKAFADTVRRQALPPEEEADFRLIIAAMFTLSPDIRADSCHKGLVLPNISTYLRSLLSANLFHNLVTAGRVDEARAVLPDAKEAAGRSGDACSRFVLELAESGLEYADGRFAPALELVERAQRSGRVAYASRDIPSVRRPAAWLLAMQAMADGDPRRARQCLCVLGEDARTSVLPLFPMDSGAGASWDAGRVRRRLWSVGVCRRLVPARRPGWAALTDSELAVARLVAQGLSNREVAEHLFLSPYTVSGHLRHVFAKAPAP